MKGPAASLRIVSLLPAATEIVCALGLADALVGISHECDYPPECVADKPVVTASLLPAVTAEIDETAEAAIDEDENGSEEDEPIPPSSCEIEEHVRAAQAAGESLYRLDADLLRELNPDLILTQTLCGVCAVSEGDLHAALGPSVSVLNLNPTTLEGVLESFRQVGAAAGRENEAKELIARTRERWEAVRQNAAGAPERPRTLLLEWIDPPYSAGHWNAELLEMANGVGGDWNTPGLPARAVSWDEITAFAPEMIIVIPCGMDATRAIDEAYALADIPGWFDLPAVREGECYAADGSAYFNRPGPRLAESAEILATILHPETFTGMLPPYAVRRFPNELLQPEDEKKGKKERRQ